MSDCSMGGRRFYNVPTHTPAEDRLEITVHFEGEFNPHQIVLNRLDREVSYVEVDGERFERVRECEMKWTGRYCPPGCMVPQDMVQTCSACGGLGNDPSRPFHPEDPNEPIQFVNLPSYIRYCPLCGARIKEVDE